MKKIISYLVTGMILMGIFAQISAVYAEDSFETQNKDSERQIVLTIDDTKAVVFGEIKENDVPPIIRNSRTMVASRFVVENLGAKVEWFADTTEVRITKDNTEILLKINSNIARVNGKNVVIDSPAFIENGRTYTPARVICENLGADVAWEESTKKITVTVRDAQEEAISTYETVTFGRYEQDNEINGKEPVEWLILQKTQNYAIAISKYGLFPKKFHTENTFTSWSNSRLKPWLENVMFDDLFTKEEKEAIMQTGTYIYLPSLNETKTYFKSDAARQCKATEYAIKQGAAVDENGNCWWWTNANSSNALKTTITPNGTIDTTTKYAADGDVCVRPIVLINLDKVKEIKGE